MTRGKRESGFQSKQPFDFYPVVNVARWLTGIALVIAVFYYYPAWGLLLLRLVVLFLGAMDE